MVCLHVLREIEKMPAWRRYPIFSWLAGREWQSPFTLSPHTFPSPPEPATCSGISSCMWDYPQRAFLDSVLSWTISSSDPKERLEMHLLLIPSLNAPLLSVQEQERGAGSYRWGTPQRSAFLRRSPSSWTSPTGVAVPAIHEGSVEQSVWASSCGRHRMSTIQTFPRGT